MKNNIRYGIFILIIIGCKPEKESANFSGEFNGYWAETSWQYKFYSNNEFVFKCEGHYGFMESKGIYERRQDSLFLLPIDSHSKKHGVENSIYLIAGDSCIIDTELKHEYCKAKIGSG